MTSRTAPASRASSAPDAIVIGAGHNGLVAANLLCDAGWDVLVCEATAHPGGAVRSTTDVGSGFVTDLFSAFYPMAAASPVMRGLELGEHGLRWAHAPAVLAHVFPDGRAVRLSRDVDATAASVGRFADGDGDAWLRMVDRWQQIQQPLLQALFAPLPAIAPLGRLLRELGLAGAARFARLAVLPVRRLGDELFDGDGARMLLAGNAAHADLAPEAAGSGLYGWLLSMVGQTFGFPAPVGGAGRLTDALVDRLRAAGGQLRCDSPVAGVDVAAGRAVGVRLSSGERLAARRAVLADVPAPALFGELVDAAELPRRLVADLAKFEWDPPTLKLNWALAGPIGWTAPEARGAGTVHLGVDRDDLTRYAGALATGQTPSRPLIVLGQMTTTDASRSPAGAESAWAYTHLPRGTHADDELVAGHAELIEQTVRRHAPGFGRLIQARQLQTPNDLQAANPALSQGAITGGTAQLHQQLWLRPTPGLGGASTPIDRLYLAGASAHPGGAVHGGPGANAARAALARSAVTGAARRRVTEAVLGRLYADPLSD